MKIAIATDAWSPQTNGVVTTLKKTGDVLHSLGHEVMYLTPEPHKTIPLPTYKEIRLALFPRRKVWSMLDQYQPDAIHIATEGPIGSAVRKYCLKRHLPFTTSYHTQFPQYMRLRLPVPLAISYWFLRRFHAPAVRTMVPTRSVQQELQRWRFEHVTIWSRGVDTDLFRPYPKNNLEQADRPIYMYVGRVAVEKNLEDFLGLDVDGTKYVVGDGPDMALLQSKYSDTVFTGYRYGEELARLLASADVFVFPSRTDTFGLVMLEAMACGVPVAAYPVTGPVDVVIDGQTGALDDSLAAAAKRALEIDRSGPRQYALEHSWGHSTRQFFRQLAPLESNLA